MTLPANRCLCKASPVSHLIHLLDEGFIRPLPWQRQHRMAALLQASVLGGREGDGQDLPGRRWRLIAHVWCKSLRLRLPFVATFAQTLPNAGASLVQPGRTGACACEVFPTCSRPSSRPRATMRSHVFRSGLVGRSSPSASARSCTAARQEQQSLGDRVQMCPTTTSTPTLGGLSEGAPQRHCKLVCASTPHAAVAPPP